MLTDAGERLCFLEVAGTPYEVGVQLGRHAADIVNSYLVRTHAWASVMAFRQDPRILAAKTLVEARFPRYWQELCGLAAGLKLPFDDVFAWNSRGDVWAMAPDGCTTVQLPGQRPVLAHNEDGHAGMRSRCSVALIRSAGGKAFSSFVYPASIPGHSFAVTEAGLVQTVNNIRSQRAGNGLPRMILTRAVLDCESIDEAIGLLACAARAGAFHVSLARAGDPRLVSVEFTHSDCSVRTIAQPRCHANHLIHPGASAEEQVITESSWARQQRGDEIIGGLGRRALDPLSVLWDRARPALPVYRAQPDDPDGENTLATAVFEIAPDKVAWRVYDRCGAPPCFAADEGLVPSSVELKGGTSDIAQVQ
jgi:predicted choloylglycine hydrolase